MDHQFVTAFVLSPVWIQYLCAMDCLRKRLRDFRLKVRRFVDRNWHNRPEGDIFRSLDILYILGAVRCKPLQKWRHVCWITYCVVSLCSFCFIVFNLLDDTLAKFDLIKVTWHASLTLGTGLCFVKDFVLRLHFESIQSARRFINSKPSGSGDTQNDEACRKKFFQRLQLMVLVFLVALLMNEIILNSPNSGIDQLLGVPRILQRLGPLLASGAYHLYFLTAGPIWFSKYVSGTATVCSILYGFKIEYELFVRGFENILDNVYVDVEEGLPSTLKAAPEWKRYQQRDQLYWKILKQRVIDQVKLHVQLVENMQLMQPVVKALFGILYYNAMVLFAPFIYVVFFTDLSMFSFVLASAIALNLLDCYGWCSVIESHQDTNDDLEMEIVNLITKIPNSEMHHKEYVEIQTTLRIMKTFVRNNQQFSCAGVFPITVEAFTDLLNIGYKVVTFLRDVGKKH